MIRTRPCPLVYVLSMAALGHKVKKCLITMLPFTENVCQPLSWAAAWFLRHVRRHFPRDPLNAPVVRQGSQAHRPSGQSPSALRVLLRQPAPVTAQVPSAGPPGCWHLRCRTAAGCRAPGHRPCLSLSSPQCPALHYSRDA